MIAQQATFWPQEGDTMVLANSMFQKWVCCNSQATFFVRKSKRLQLEKKKTVFWFISKNLCTICMPWITQSEWDAMKTNKRRWRDSPLMFNYTLQFHTLLNVGKTRKLPESTAEKKRLVLSMTSGHESIVNHPDLLSASCQISLVNTRSRGWWLISSGLSVVQPIDRHGNKWLYIWNARHSCH